MTVGVVTGAGSGMGRATVDRLRGTVDHLVATADEVAAVVAFLLSDDASFVSGIDVLVDGALAPGGAAAVGAR